MSEIKLEYTQVFGFKAALRGMRNAHSSWNKSDSQYHHTWFTSPYEQFGWGIDIDVPECPCIGPNDLELCKKLIRGGPEHAKFLRQIQVWVDITIPRFLWQELDTYKIATVRNSCSTRASELKKRAFTENNFIYRDVDSATLDELNYLAEQGKQDKDCLRKLKRRLPEGYLQKATYSLNYQNVGNVRHQRKSHWLKEWQVIIQWIDRLPYAKKFFIQ